MTDDNTNWRKLNFRQMVIQKINEAILSTGASCSLNSIEMEAEIFKKATNIDEYLELLARLILYVRDMNSGNQNPRNIDNVNNTGDSGMSDLINALQNMASPGTRNPQMTEKPGADPTGDPN